MFEPPDEAFSKYLNEDGTVREQFCDDDGKLMGKGEYGDLVHKNLIPNGGGGLKNFKKFADWHDTYGEAWKIKLQPKTSSDELSACSFSDFDELVNKVKSIDSGGTEGLY